MNDYATEKWFDLYKTALLELERAAMTGRISDARAEITTRLETLQQHPNLHYTELSAIRDALNNLRALEREEERLAAEDKKRILQQAAQKLKSIAHKFPPRCPYCVSETGFVLLKVLENGRQICEKCGHIAFPEDEAFQCPCLKCVEARMSPKIRRLNL